MNKRVGELTLKDLESMPRTELLDSLMQITAFFPRSVCRSTLEELPEFELRSIVNRARRKLQGMGY